MRALFDLPAAYQPSDDDRAAPVPPVEAVLCDFSNTLFRMIGTEEWLRRIAADTGRELGDPEAVLAALDAAAAEPEVDGRTGGPRPRRRRPPPRDARVVLPRALPRGHRGRRAGAGGGRGLVGARTATPGRSCAALAERGVPVGVVSDIGWDIRGHARAAGLDGLVGTWVLSCEEGTEKPDPALFRTACERLGADPRRTLMVGDNPVRDGGAVAAGLRAFVLAGEQRERERGLRDVLALVSPRG